MYSTYGLSYKKTYFHMYCTSLLANENSQIRIRQHKGIGGISTFVLYDLYVSDGHSTDT